ncbi:MAG: hypothetical protein F6K54_21710 [Okeania sp. SIO3B5]|uniref:hypothetical protein n=1 Tax=Okeania sp. SIO3B5 TaxID=2607811 RepID=UPI00140002B2|nr:hypothetical protein [Okeania sp. SIO3B5]NEO55454.1 hypothetical protein [Okeania sp. SIO3B5]
MGKRSDTQHSLIIVGFPTSTQPTNTKFSLIVCSCAFALKKLFGLEYNYWSDTPKNVGWVERSDTQHSLIIVGFPTSTQPTNTKKIIWVRV